MPLLLDECVPRPLKLELLGHDVWLPAGALAKAGCITWLTRRLD
jgi:hypothetical protein